MTESRTYASNRHSLRHDGKRYGLGDAVPLTEDQAKPLLASGAVTDVTAVADAQQAFTPADSAEGVATVAADPDPTDDDAFADPLEGKDTEAVAGESAGDAAQKAAPAASDPPAVRGKKKAR